MDSFTDSKKSHHAPQAGKKARRKEEKKNANKHENGQPNPRAFTMYSAVRAGKEARRRLDISTKKHHVPMADRSAVDPPPFIVAVVGPPKVGKTTLIKSLVKHYTKQKIADPVGPITIVTGKKKRLTLMECNNDLNAMLDVAKVADLVLMLVDASYGFEMETFEFLNILQVHGFPKVMGVLTHLDMFKQNKRLTKTKKRLKDRFWTEIYQGAKLFYLSGLVGDGYHKREILNLSRFISIMKFRPLVWKSTHPYILADRVEDLTDPEQVKRDPKMARHLSLYGYCRGINLKPNMKVHIPGCGDMYMKNVTYLPDPCPLPDKEKKRKLSDKETLLYAPMCDVGDTLYDKDAVYIEMGNNVRSIEVGADDKDIEVGEGAGIVNSLINTRTTLNDTQEQSEMRLFSNQKPLKGDENIFGDNSAEPSKSDESESESEYNSSDDSEDGESEEEEQEPHIKEMTTKDANGRVRRRAVFADEDEDDDDDDDESLPFEDDSDDDDVFGSNNEESGNSESDNEDQSDDTDDTDDEVEAGSEWKRGMRKKAEEGFFSRRATNLMDLVYGTSQNQKSKKNEKEDEDGFFRIKTEDDDSNEHDTSKFQIKEFQDWTDTEVQNSIKNKFVTGDWEGEDAATLLAQDNSDDEHLFGDFEDLTTGEVHGPNSKNEDDVDDSQDDGDDGEDDDDEGKATAEDYRAKKAKQKAAFDRSYDNTEVKDDEKNFTDMKDSFARQADINRSEFEGDTVEARIAYEGYRPGLYVRMEFTKMPCEFYQHFDPSYPVIIGGLLSNEENFGFVHARVKKHRWHARILKNNDPLILSIGWRRFQTVMQYSIQDHNKRNRLLKYTPKHMHCRATFWGPLTTPNTGLLGVQTLSSSPSFRISATGVVLELDAGFKIVKKLKLTGVPDKVFKNTCFVKDMFTSDLEVSKFVGASLRTVSGIRGTIKKALPSPQGSFRATFEDKILPSDIIFLRAWFPVEAVKFYNPVTSLLRSDKGSWQGMKTVGQLRYEKKLKAKSPADSQYKDIVRPEVRFAPLKIPKSLQADLPYKSKPKLLAKKSLATKKKQKSNVVAKVMEKDEKDVYKLMQQLNTIKNVKSKAKYVKQKEANKQKAKVQGKEDARIQQKQKEKRKEIIRKRAKAEVAASRKRFKQDSKN